MFFWLYCWKRGSMFADIETKTKLLKLHVDVTTNSHRNFDKKTRISICRLYHMLWLIKHHITIDFFLNYVFFVDLFSVSITGTWAYSWKVSYSCLAIIKCGKTCSLFLQIKWSKARGRHSWEWSYECHLPKRGVL